MYFWLMIAMLSLSQLFETTAVCADWRLAIDWHLGFYLKSSIIITIVLIFNTVIGIVVLPKLWRQKLNDSNVIWFAIFLWFSFEGIMIYREFIVQY